MANILLRKGLFLCHQKDTIWNNKNSIYKWSSDIYYRNNIKSFVNTGIIYDMLDKDTDSAIQKYKEFMEESEDTNYSKLDAIGEEAYVVLCMSRKEEKIRKRLDEILFNTGVSITEYKQIKAGSRKRIFAECKRRYAIAAKEQRYTLKKN